GSRARSGRIILMATDRPRRVSRPRYTSAIPPRPMSSPTSYRPLIMRCGDTVFLIGRYAVGSAPLVGEVLEGAVASWWFVWWQRLLRRHQSWTGQAPL